MNNYSASATATQVAIIGGGPAGCCCAIRLIQQGIDDIVIIESSDYQQFRIGESIPPQTKQLFHQLEIWSAFVKQQHQPCYGSRSWWGDNRNGFNDSLLSPYGHGWHLDRQKFNRFLAEQAQSAGVTLLTQCQFKTGRLINEKHYNLTLDRQGAEHQLNAKFVVDASGARASFAQTQGSKKQSNHALVSLGRRFIIKDKHYPLSQQTHLEAVENGWWYAARLPNDRVLISLTTDPQTAKTFKLHETNNWLDILVNSPNTKALLQGVTPEDTQPKRYPASSFCLNPATGKNWLAIGDAACTFDPITSGGIIKAMADGVTCADIIAGIFKTSGHDTHHGLMQYQQMLIQRYQHYLAMRAHYYQQEKRFLNSPFWQKMQAMSPHKIHSKMELQANLT